LIARKRDGIQARKTNGISGNHHFNSKPKNIDKQVKAMSEQHLVGQYLQNQI
jgi:hypothetical protein